MRTLLSSLFATGLLASGITAQTQTPILGPVLDQTSVIPGTDLHRCGTPTTRVNGAPFDNPDCNSTSTNPTSNYDLPAVQIPVVVHILRRNNGTGDLTNAEVQSQIDVLNEDFGGFGAGTGGFDTKIQFVLATIDPQGNPSTGILRYSNNTWYNDGGDYWTSTSWDSTRYLNIYTNNAGGGGVLGYVPALPSSGFVLGTPRDRVVINHVYFGRIGAASPFDLGRTCTHEVGHYLGLEHTFNGGCGGGNCYTSGDLICDTNAESSPRFGCPTGATSCGSLDPINNYMDYTHDSCMNGFTREQSRRMRCTLLSYRPSLGGPVGPPAPSASLAFRSGPGNRNIALNAGLPVLGAAVTVQVFDVQFPFDLAAVYVYERPANLPLQGYTLLVDPTSVLITQLPLQAPGPAGALWTATIPNDPSVAGRMLYLQAVMFGASNFALSNAIDATVGV